MSGEYESSAMSNALLQFTDFLSQINEMSLGYKANLEAMGFTTAAAEAMTIDMHRKLMEIALSGRKK